MLSEEKRKRYLKTLGFRSVKALQEKYLAKKHCDGVYGPATDRLLKHVWNVTLYAPHFRPEEFKCECGGRHCNGYPTYMKQQQLRQLEAIRQHWGKPMIITCGMRCKGYNRELNGSISNSLHLVGRATDFYMLGVTDCLSHRKEAVRWIKKRPYHDYTYGNGINSYGSGIKASYMGNALHTDTQKMTQYYPKSIPSIDAIRKREAACIWAENLALDNSYKYKHYAQNHSCHICHPRSPKGYNCIGLVCAAYAHGAGIEKMKKNCAKDNGAGLGNNYTLEHNVEANWIKKNGLGWAYKVAPGKKFTASQMRRGDILICYDAKGVYKHVALYVGRGYIVDAKSSGDNISRRPYSKLGVRAKRLFRWKGGE